MHGMRGRRKRSCVRLANKNVFANQKMCTYGRESWSSGMGGDSYSKGHGFESRHHIPDGHDILSH